MKRLLTTLALAAAVGGAAAQSALYPNHFDLSEVTLLDSPLKTAMELNIKTLLQYDVDRLLTPYIRQAGLSDDSSSSYYGWETKHPSFDNWGNSSFNLDGHVGGHYLSALSLAYAATDDAESKAALLERLNYMIDVLADCQAAFDEDLELYGFIGGQPINDVWKTLYKGDISAYQAKGGWVPFYCEHKILAGLRDAWLYAGNEEALQLFYNLAMWAVNVVKNVSDSDMQTLLNIEHGGMNESLMDAYTIFGTQEFLTAAKKYSHKTMLNGMQSVATSFLDGKHANTQVPKYIGFAQIGESNYLTAAKNFWQDVAENRTVCIGGNSVSEHFLAAANSNRYIDNLDGPESCNSNNMLKLSEMLSDDTHDAKYADFYEGTMYNHILSTQDPKTGGYVYFTTLRPQGYRIYSQVNQAMWCCVGTGMENHSKYGHFIYTREGATKLYVNLFTASKLNNSDFAITQETNFPFEQQTTLTVDKAGTYTIAVRHPSWTTDGFAVSVNGSEVSTSVTEGTASYVEINRTWAAGDVITVSLPMKLRYEECPNYTDYIAFKYGPILLGGEIEATDLTNEYAGEGRMDHAPGSRATSKSLTDAPLLIGERADVLSKITEKDLSTLTFTIDASRDDASTYTWTTLTLKPFYSIHHARYMCYWYQATAEEYANSDMAKTEAENEALQQRTLDFVAPGEQQSEAGHEVAYSNGSTTGDYGGEHCRDAQAGGYVQYTLYNPTLVKDSLAILCRFTHADAGRKATIYVDDVAIAEVTITSGTGFYNIEYPLPDSVAVNADGTAKEQFVVKIVASSSTLMPGLYYLRLMSGYEESSTAYKFVASEWVTGDSWRVAQSNISYDSDANVITVKASGSNNVALQLDYQNTDYTVKASQIYLVVRGRNLSTTDGASYLWWLNGVNRGSQVAPTSVQTVTLDNQTQQVIAWDMTQSNLYDNFTGDEPSVCQGMTIFGLTSTTGTSYIHDINFVENIDDYIATATRIASPQSAASQGDADLYDLSGRKLKSHPAHGVYIANGKKRVL